MHNEFESEDNPIKFWQLRVQAPRIKQKRKKSQKTSRFVSLCNDKQKCYWIVQWNCVIRREIDLCKRRKKEWFSKVAWLVWMTLSDVIRKQVNILLRQSAQNTEPQNLYIRNNSRNLPPSNAGKFSQSKFKL